MSTFSLSPAVLQKFPNLNVGILFVKGAKNGPASSDITSLLRAEEARVRSEFTDPEQLKSHPMIAAWQQVHRDFGSNPNKFMCSIHALLKRVVKGGELPAIGALVDAYNIISLRYKSPVGGEDLDTCQGDISLKLADGTEAFTALGEEGNDPPLPGEVIYADAVGVLCRRFNWREAARTCLTEKTKNAVLVIECIPPMTEADLKKALEELTALIRSSVEEVKMVVLDQGSPSVAF
jgi:DNA/RNA-binding domain of Phe-tRNA-synthetase-like protein